MQAIGADGTASCMCAAGFEIMGGDRCVPCALTTFKSAAGNHKCTECPSPAQRRHLLVRRRWPSASARVACTPTRPRVP
jgi:hypothetical protein